MPYNNTPIAPNKEITGHVSLPLARVQKIIQADPERITTSKNAAFAIALATEMFIQHLATTTHNVVKAERKPRRNIQYRDVSSAVAKTDNLEFLVDVAPKTSTWGTVKKKIDEKEKEDAKRKEKEVNKDTLANGQTKLGAAPETAEEDEAADKGETSANGATASSTPPEKADETPDAMEVDQEADRVANSEPEEEDAAAMQIEMEMRGPPRQPAASETKSTSPAAARRSTGFTAINGSK
ncbi:histone-fold-containing protein [Stemphylium lycopersici]|uniref:Histone-fold-containing protein n=1 Tax=Stemphylium lycopersici TaxID=183478 RepID=A0A364N010_STELY|nr:histone-fold-containing protein [Stemphylium lycopersici]RAR08225.1 histone-fold-containing protein [Stemphylium lycopersici]